MRWIRVILLSVLLTPAIVFAYTFWESYLTDDFDVFLLAMGYNPLHPPRNEFPLGSLYDIDDSGNLDLVCPTSDNMADKYLGPDSQEIARERTGSFSMIGDIANRMNANVGDEYSKKIKISLRDIRMLQIPSNKDGEIQEALISNRACLKAVTNRLRLGHYICQVQSSFSAVAVYKTDDEVNTSAAAKQPHAEPARMEAVRANTNMQTKESGDTVLTGNLVFGVKLEPVCISPLHSIFVRTWRRSIIGRAIDFIKYEMIEPLFVKDLFGEDNEATVANQL